MDGVAFNSKSILESVDSFVNLADFTDSGSLDGTNINNAFQSAKNVSNTYYVPKGSYIDPAIVIDWDCYILCDPEAIFDRTIDTAHAAIRFESCSVHLSGGTFRSGVFDPVTSTPGRRRYTEGLIHCLNVSNCIFENIVVPYSNSNCALRLNNSRNITIQNCEFNNCLLAGVIFAQVLSTTNPLCTKEIADNSYNFAVRNCKFNNMLRAIEEGHSWCYAVYTGVSGNLKTLDDTHLTWESVMDASIRPMNGLVYDNNYVNGSEDCGLDTHGASNVQISNNTVLNTVCAITAYNDNNREPRPLDWNMENITIFNNYCYSEKQNDDMVEETDLPHPFVFLGASNCGLPERSVGWSYLLGYHCYSNCKVYNNIFITANDFPIRRTSNYSSWFYTARGGTNLTVTNNVFKTLPQTNGEFATKVASIRQYINVNFTNNIHEGGLDYKTPETSSGKIDVSRSIGNYSNNIGFLPIYSDMFYLHGMNFIDAREKGKTLAKLGDIFWRQNTPVMCTSYGFRYLSATNDPYVLEHTCEVTGDTIIDNVVHGDVLEAKYVENGVTKYFNHNLLGDAEAIELVNASSGTTYRRYVYNVISGYKCELSDTVPIGTYTVSIRVATLEDISEPEDPVAIKYHILENSQDTSWILLKLKRSAYTLEFHNCSGDDTDSPTTLVSDPYHFHQNHPEYDICCNCNYGGADYSGRLNGVNYVGTVQRQHFAFDTDDQVLKLISKTTAITSIDSKYDTVFAVDLMIRSNGTNNSNITDSGDYEPRTVFGWDSSYWYILSCEGRGNQEKGMRLWNVLNLFVDQGILSGVNWDGGGSCCLTANINGNITRINKYKDQTCANTNDYRKVGLVACFKKV